MKNNNIKSIFLLIAFQCDKLYCHKQCRQFNMTRTSFVGYFHFSELAIIFFLILKGFLLVGKNLVFIDSRNEMLAIKVGQVPLCCEVLDFKALLKGFSLRIFVCQGRKMLIGQFMYFHIYFGQMSIPKEDFDSSNNEQRFLISSDRQPRCELTGVCTNS